MCKDLLRLVRNEGKSLKQNLSKEFYLNKTGSKNTTQIAEILKHYRDLLETEIFISFRDFESKSEEEANGIRLICSFLAQSVLLGKSANIEDAILELEASSLFSIGKSRVPFREYKSALIKHSKEEETEEIAEKSGKILSKLNQLYLRQYAYKQKDSHDLGYKSYLDLYEMLGNIESSQIVELSKELIRDTDYISKDLLSWFFSKRMNIDLKDAEINDLYYLIHSFELKDSFPKLTPHNLAQNLLDESGIILPAVIKFDTNKRKGHIPGSYLFISNPGVEMVISTNLERNISDYESFLESYGRSLLYGFTNRDDYFEYTYLREKSFEKIFSILSKNLLFEPAWLKKYFRLDCEDDFIKFLNLRRLIMLRILCSKVIYETAIYQNHDNKAEIYTEIMKTATYCEPNADQYLNDIAPHLSSLDELKGYLMESQLRKFMLENYDEQWWRESAANEFLANIWEQGGRVSSESLSKKCGFGDLNISGLKQNFEQTLG